MEHNGDRSEPATDASALSTPKGPVDWIDGIVAAILIVLCVFFYTLTYDFPVPGAFLGDNVLPEQFPRLLLFAIGIMALALPFEHKLETKRWPLIRKSRSAPIGSGTFATIAFLLILVAVAEFLGTIVTIFIAAAGLPFLWGERRWLLVLVYSLIFTALVTYLFSSVLSVYFEPGLFNLTLR